MPATGVCGPCANSRAVAASRPRCRLHSVLFKLDQSPILGLNGATSRIFRTARPSANRKTIYYWHLYPQGPPALLAADALHEQTPAACFLQNGSIAPAAAVFQPQRLSPSIIADGAFARAHFETLIARGRRQAPHIFRIEGRYALRCRRRCRSPHCRACTPASGVPDLPESAAENLNPNHDGQTNFIPFFRPCRCRCGILGNPTSHFKPAEHWQLVVPAPVRVSPPPPSAPALSPRNSLFLHKPVHVFSRAFASLPNHPLYSFLSCLSQ